MGVTPAEDAEIRATIAANPLAGDVIPGLDGLRKLRFAFGVAASAAAAAPSIS